MCIRDRFQLVHVHDPEVDAADRGRVIIDEPEPAYRAGAVSYTHLRAHETGRNLVCRLLLEKKKKKKIFFFFFFFFFFLMIRRPPRSTLDRSSAASDVYKRQPGASVPGRRRLAAHGGEQLRVQRGVGGEARARGLSLIHISEPTRQAEISY